MSKQDKGSNAGWGRLKSGVGWNALSLVKIGRISINIDQSDI